jgi:site-specific DNA recombinase
MMATVPSATPVRPETSRTDALLAECDRELAQYRAALAAGADPAIVTKWINETQAMRARLQGQLRRPQTPAIGRYMTADEINEMLDQLGDVGEVLRSADLTDKAALYRDLGLNLTFNPTAQSVYVRADLGKERWAADCVGGGN